MNRTALPQRRPGQVRRTPARRPAPGLTWLQIVAVGLVAAFGSGIYAIGISPTFAVRTLDIHGATFTSDSIVRAILGMDDSPNAFRLDTDSAAQQLARLPAVESASVQVRLPGTVEVTLVERQPKLVWDVGGRRYVVDEDGLLFGMVDDAGNPIASDAGPMAAPTEIPAATDTQLDTSSAAASPTAAPTPTPEPTPSPSPTATPKPSPTKKGARASATPSGGASDASSPNPTYDASLLPSLAPAPTADAAASSGPGALGLAVVYDRRAADAGMGLGSVVDPINLDAAYRLASVTPGDLDSSASSLAVVLDDDHGFTVSSVPTGWVAEFGFYTPTARQDTVIPVQVRDLRSALANWGESKVAWVYLVSDVSDNHDDTVILR